MNRCIYNIRKTKYEFIPDLSINTKFFVINDTIEKYFGISIVKLATKSRKREYVYPRQIAMTLHYLHCTSYSLEYIGHFFGGRDHTTVIHSFEQVKAKVESEWNDPLKEYYYDIVKLLPFEPKPMQYRIGKYFLVD